MKEQKQRENMPFKSWMHSFEVVTLENWRFSVIRLTSKMYVEITIKKSSIEKL